MPTRATTTRASWLGSGHATSLRIARIEGRSADGRTTRHQSNLVQRSRFVGIAKTQLAAYMVGAAQPAADGALAAHHRVDRPHSKGINHGRANEDQRTRHPNLASSDHCAKTGITRHSSTAANRPRTRARARLRRHPVGEAVHDDWDAALTDSRVGGSSRSRRAPRGHYADACFAADDVFVFGPETRGPPEAVLHSIACGRAPAPADDRRQPQPEPVQRGRGRRPYEAWRQLGFAGAVPSGSRVS